MHHLWDATILLRKGFFMVLSSETFIILIVPYIIFLSIKLISTSLSLIVVIFLLKVWIFRKDPVWTKISEWHSIVYKSLTLTNINFFFINQTTHKIF